MKPVSPVIPGVSSDEVVIAKDQPQYNPLPAIHSKGPSGKVTTRWRMTWLERIRAFWTGDIYLQILTFQHPLQPVMVSVEPPNPYERFPDWEVSDRSIDLRGQDDSILACVVFNPATTLWNWKLFVGTCRSGSSPTAVQAQRDAEAAFPHDSEHLLAEQ